MSLAKQPKGNPMTATIARGDLASLATILETQQVRKLDAVVPAKLLHVNDDGTLLVPGLGEAKITLDGVTPGDATLGMSDLAVGHLATRHDMPITYLRRCKTEAPELFASNANTWLARDNRSAFLRTFTDPDGGIGYARAILSDKYRVVDDLDVLMAALEGARSTGHEIAIDSVDLTERAMRVRFVAPEISVLAPDFLRGYRTPFANGWHGEQGMQAHGFYAPGEEPIIFAGIELSNSETGGGAFTVRPRMIVKVCRNGLVITRDAIRSVHVGKQLDAGVVRWSEATANANADLVKSQMTDAISTFLDVPYMQRILAEIGAKAGTEIDRPAEAIETVANKLRYTEGERETLLAHFIKGGQATAGGIYQAVTSLAQTIADPDRAADVEASAFEALMLVG